MKLHEDYAQVRSNILMTNPLPNITQAYTILIAEQKHKDISKTTHVTNESFTFAVDKRRFSNKSSFAKSNDTPGRYERHKKSWSERSQSV